MNPPSDHRHAPPRRWSAAGAVLAFVGVAAGAFGAHALRDVLPPDRMAIYQTATLYQVLHAVAIVAIGLAPTPQSRGLRRSALLLAVGVVIFSGSLFILALSGVRWWGAVTPIGGVAFLAGWLNLAVTCARADAGPQDDARLPK
jgi:uncharacterized membrane protein YgdD (TMEM256/DUF423 family)